MRALHPGARQVKIAAQPQPVAEQAREAGTTGQRKLEQFRALHHGRRLELASLETQRERHRHPGQIQAPRNKSIGQPQPARVDLILELATALAE